MAKKVEQHVDEDTLAKWQEENPHLEMVGRAFVVQEALGYLCGTVIAAAPFEIQFGPDSVMIRDMGPLGEAMRTGRVAECHAIPWVKLKDHAIRYVWPWPHPVPKPGRNNS